MSEADGSLVEEIQDIYTYIPHTGRVVKGWGEQNHSHGPIRMNLRIMKILPHIRKIRQNFLPRPPQPASQQRHTQPFQPTPDVRQRPQPDQLVPLILRPTVRGPLVVVDCDFCEARGEHAGLVLGCVGEGAAEDFAGLGEVVAPFFEGCAF